MNGARTMPPILATSAIGLPGTGENHRYQLVPGLRLALLYRGFVPVWTRGRSTPLWERNFLSYHASGVYIHPSAVEAELLT